MHRIATVSLASLLLALPLASCGGDDAPTKAEFAKQAEDICKDAQQSVEKLGQANSREELAEGIDKGIDAARNSIDDLKELDRPDGDAGETADRFVKALDTQIKGEGIPVLEDLRDAIKANDQKAAQAAFKRLQSVDTTDAAKASRELGISGCAD